jgi:hypothetical protein
MSARRIGRRLASMTPLQNPCSHAVSARTLARKVFHYQCHPFSLWCGGRRLVGKAAQSMIAPPDGGTCSSTGVRVFRRRGGARRFVCSAMPDSTPLTTSSLVTKGKNNGGAE